MGRHSAKKVSVMPCQKCQGMEETSPGKEVVLMPEIEKGRKKTTRGIVLLQILPSQRLAKE